MLCKGDYDMIKAIKDLLKKYVPVRLTPAPTLAMGLEVKRMVIEEVVLRKIGYLTETDKLMIKRLTFEQKLTGEEIVQEVLESPRQPSSY